MAHPLDELPKRTYHGLPKIEENGGQHISVEQFGGGPTERKQVETLYLLESLYQHYGPYEFWWGYTGSGAHRAAESILVDALSKQKSEDLPPWMAHAFCVDVVAHLDDEWHLNVRMILRWVRGWCAENDVPLPFDPDDPIFSMDT